MGKKTERALVAIHEALAEQAAEISAHDRQIGKHDSLIGNLSKIVQSQATDIANLQQQVQHLRDRSIQSAIDRGVPTKVVALAHNLTSGRVSQIAPRKRPPLC